MKSKLFGCLAATVLRAAVAFPTSAIAFHGGGGFGGGGMHGGFGGGGFSGGMHGGIGGGGMHFSGGGFAGGGFRGGMVTGRSAFVPGGGGFRFRRAFYEPPPAPYRIDQHLVRKVWAPAHDLTGVLQTPRAKQGL
jgi:hypothetical protein